MYGPLLWGSPGGLRYRAEPPDPRHFPEGTRWVSLSDDAGLAAALILAPMATATGDLALRLAVAERMQGQGVASALARFVAENLDRPVVGTIEADNVRSLRTARSAGGHFLARCVARVVTHRGRSDRAVQRGLPAIAPEATMRMLGQVDDDAVWTSGGSGALLVRHRWEVTALGGPLGSGILRVVWLAGLDPRAFVFLSAHGCWGSPPELQAILSHAMRATGSMAVILVATERTDEDRLHAGLRRGVGGRLVGVSGWDVVGSPGASWTCFEPLATR